MKYHIISGYGFNFERLLHETDDLEMAISIASEHEGYPDVRVWSWLPSGECVEHYRATDVDGEMLCRPVPEALYG